MELWAQTPHRFLGKLVLQLECLVKFFLGATLAAWRRLRVGLCAVNIAAPASAGLLRAASAARRSYP
jgi:hypothetical protein